MKKAFAVLAAVLSAGCAAVGPDYTPPKTETPASWRGADRAGVAADGADLRTAADWWSSFGDPALSGLVERAVRKNLDVRTALARLREARASRGRTAAGALPSAEGSGSASWSRTGGKSGGGTGETYTAGLDASWELDIFGGVRRSVEAADADLQARTESLRDTLVSLTAEVALNYIETRVLQAELAVLEANARSQAETLDLAKWRREAGLSDDLAVEQARLNLESTRSQAPDVRASLDAAMNRIAVLLGERPGTVHAELGKASAVPAVPDRVAVGIPAEALRRRPDIRAAERELAAQTARVGVAVADLYPKFRLGGSIGIEALSVRRPGVPDLWRIGGGPSVSWPVFNAGSIRRNIEVQTAVQEQYLVKYEAAVLAALEEVENALTSYGEARLKRDSLRAAADAARTTAKLAEEKYRTGLSDFTAVLEAQRSLLGTENQLTQIDGALASGLVRLYKALGGGWTPFASDGAPMLSNNGETK